MDFFGAQDAARARTRTLVVLFVAAVVAIIIAVYLVVHLTLLSAGSSVDPRTFLLVAAGTTALIASGSFFRTMQLRQGGSRVAELLGGRRVAQNTTDEAERRLINVVEEMSLASGTPVPAIYVLDNESGINAFAAGYSTSDAAVAVTRGTLDRLNRDELQGVIAHEFSHVLNGDMRLNIRLMGLLFGILLLAVIGRGILRGSGRGRSRKGGGQAALLGLGLVAIGYIGVFFGRLIQAGVSRQREFLADASSVQFTRNPEGIVNALKKIGTQGSRLDSHHAQEASHLFFASGLAESFAGLFATHPPLTDRIKRIDTRFAGALPAQSPGPAPAFREAGVTPLAAGIGGAAVAPGESAAPAPGVGGAALSRGIGSAALIDSIGTLRPEHVVHAGQLLRSLPATVTTAAHDHDGVVPLLFALLLHEGTEHTAAQHVALRQHGGEAMVTQATALAAELAPLGTAVRLPLLDLLLPTLRGLPVPQLIAVQATARTLVATDSNVDVFEFALLHLLGRQVSAASGQRNAAATTKTHNPGKLRGEFESVLSALAWAGSADEARAQRAFAAGATSLPRQLAGMTLQARDALTLQVIDHALDKLQTATPGIRRTFIEACTYTVAEDGMVHAQEAELLRAVSEAIDCPMPPLLVGALSPVTA